ncbi:MAG: hypothetical protein HOP13_01875 [Alphaproteobacteria bacterium]|nr:hypothetical protein [Alphaproteobacteria bacterium]
MNMPANPQQFNENSNETGEEKIVQLPALFAFIRRHQLDIASFRRIVRKRPQGNYSRDEVAIRITPKLEVEFPLEDVQPSALEKAAIVDEIKGANWPTWQPAFRVALPDELKNVAPENLFIFYSQHARADHGLGPMRPRDKKEDRHEILMIEHRFIGRNGKKVCVLWTYWSDGKWRPMEPDDQLLPLYGLHLLNDAVMVYLHEGAKAARAGQEIAEGRRKHPWKDALQYTTHLGWPGGAPNPDRVDWSPLRKFTGSQRIIADNDEPGINAVPKISNAVGRSMWCVRFDQDFPTGFDLADPWPKHKKWYAATTGEYTTGEYIGPTIADLAFPATWATKIVKNAKKVGRPPFEIRDEFASEWIYAPEPDLYVHRDRPQDQLTESVFDATIHPFSHSTKTSTLLKDKLGSQVRSLAYRPGSKTGIIEGGKKFNIYEPSSIKPMEGNPKPWLEFIEQLFPIESDRREVMRWCATLIAQPKTRMLYSLLLVSEQQGVGKSCLARILARLVGMHNTGWPSENDITQSAFNPWLAHKRLVVVNEVYAGENHHAYNKLKSYITDPEVTVNKKFQQPYVIENHAHFILCSNNKTRALKIDDADRRLLVPTVTEQPMPGAYWNELHKWLDEGGLSIIAGWAKKFGDYVQAADRAPMTGAKQDMLRAGWSPGKTMVFDLAEKIKAAFDDGKMIAVGRDIVHAWLAVARGLTVNDSKLEGRDLVGSTLAAAGLHLVVDVPGKRTPRFQIGTFKTPIYTNYPTLPGIKSSEVTGMLTLKELTEDAPWSPKM